MATLAINTASKTTAIALIKDKKILVEKSWGSENDEAEKLMPEIAKLFKKGKLEYNDIKKIIVVRGPGSFTGLRIGVTVANTIAYLQKLPVHSINTFQYLRQKNKDAKDAGLSANPKQLATALLLFAGKKEVYIQFKASQNPLLEKTEDAKTILKEKKIKKIFGELLEDQKKELESKSKIKFKESKQTFGEAILKTPQKEFKKDKIVQPLYIKGPGISTPKPIK